MTTNTMLKSKILFRVYVIWFLRRIVPLVAIQIIGLVVALKLFANNVFVSKVFQNAELVAGENLWNILKYLVLAFLQTRFIIQILVLLGLGIGALILRDIGRALITYASTLRTKKNY